MIKTNSEKRFNLIEWYIEFKCVTLFMVETVTLKLDLLV